MNGDAQKIFDEVVLLGNKLTVLETQQKERHKSNLARMTKLDNLPCDIHLEKWKGLSISVNRVWVCFWFIMTALIGVAIKAMAH